MGKELKFTVTVTDNSTGKESIKCQCNAVIVGVAIEDEAFAFHISGTHDEMREIVNVIEAEADKIFSEE